MDGSPIEPKPAKRIEKIVIDRTLCIGAASCVAVAPSGFELDAENKAVLRRKDKKSISGPVERSELEDQSIDDDTLLLAAQSCPTKAIFLFDGEGKQIYP